MKKHLDFFCNIDFIKEVDTLKENINNNYIKKKTENNKDNHDKNVKKDFYEKFMDKFLDKEI